MAAAGQAGTGRPADSRRDPVLQTLADRVVVGPNPNPGAFLLARDGSRERFGAAGLADRSAGTPMTPDLRFRAGSLTKTFTATVVLQLVAEHRLRLDDTVQRLLPDQVRPGNALSDAPITVRELLNHTSGLYDYIDGLLPHFRTIDQYWPRDQLIGVGLGRPRYFPAPGTRFRYSNTNYLLLDLIIERVTDRDLRTNLERRVFAPLGLRDTSYPLAATAIDGAHAHGYTDVSLLLPDAPDATRYDVTAFSPSEAGASGALVTTAADIARFYRALLRGRLLPRSCCAACSPTPSPPRAPPRPPSATAWACTSTPPAAASPTATAAARPGTSPSRSAAAMGTTSSWPTPTGTRSPSRVSTGTSGRPSSGDTARPVTGVAASFAERRAGIPQVGLGTRRLAKDPTQRGGGHGDRARGEPSEDDHHGRCHRVAGRHRQGRTAAWGLRPLDARGDAGGGDHTGRLRGVTAPHAAHAHSR
ncbi:serine hydrolase domain-containing protein [Streptomyces nogalater]